MKTENLQEYKELARMAAYWTSFNPDRWGDRTILEHEHQLLVDLEGVPEDEKQRYIDNYKKYFSSWLNAHSKCASSAITGGSGFDVRRAEKANNREQSRYEDFTQWREKALKAIVKRKEANRPESEKRAEVWKGLEKSILNSAATIHGLNIGIERGYSKSLFVNSIYNKVETFAKRGDIEMVEKAIKLVRRLNETMSSIITERHKFFNLLEVAEAAKEKSEDMFSKEATEVAFKGGVLVQNWAEDRVQLIFDEKPSADFIAQLKKAAFRWSPRFGAWQRQNTTNGVYAAKSFLEKNELIIK